MKRTNLIKRLGVAAVAIALCLGTTVGTTYAYYTDATQAQGSLIYKTDTPSTEITEERNGTNKVVSIQNTSDTPVLVRVKVLYAQANAEIKIGEGTEEGWVTDSNGWFYYSEPLWNKGDSTKNLKFEVNPKDDSLKEFNVTVIQQCAALSWDEEAQSYAGTFVKDGDPVVIKSITKAVVEGMPVPGSGTLGDETDSDQ